MYDITYTGLHVYSLYHNVMYRLVYIICILAVVFFMYFVLCVTNLALRLQETNNTYLLTYLQNLAKINYFSKSETLNSNTI